MEMQGAFMHRELHHLKDCTVFGGMELEDRNATSCAWDD
jgi:hypothetical protein